MRIKAEVTVFFSLILCTVMAFVIITARHSLLSYIKIKAEAITDSSVKSSFSEYSKSMFDNYNILCVDTTYKGKTGSIELFERHIKEYMEESLSGDRDNMFVEIERADCNVEKYLLLSDLNAKPFILQVCDYSDRNIGNFLNVEFVENSREYEGDVEIFMDEICRQILFNSSSIERFEIPSERILKNGNYSVSVFQNEMCIDGKKYADFSKEKIKRNISLYGINKFSSYNRKVNPSYLNYENEYLIFGNKNDYENLYKMIEKILCMELAFYHYDDYLEKMLEEYEDYEHENYDSFEDYFYAELDFEKTSSPYVKSINNVLKCLNNERDVRGYSYEDYLYTFLNKTDEKELPFRMLNLIEINMRYLENDSFRIDNLIEYAEVKTEFNTSTEKTYYKKHEYGFFSR